MNIDTIKIAGLGEVLWDIQNEEKTFGGAPANFACHCANFGASSFVISSVGNDELGKSAIQFLENHKVNCKGISINNDKQTGVVNVSLDKNGIPDYEIKEGVAWDDIIYKPELDHLISDLDAICFGTLAQRHLTSRNSINAFLDACPSGCLKVFDINIRQHYYNDEIILNALQKADVIKLNDDELPLLVQILNIEGDEKRQLQSIVSKFNLKLAILTLGAKGAIMVTPDEINREKHSDPVDVKSTVGAGDAFTATAIIGYLLNKPLKEINKKSNNVAAYVCTQTGAVPSLPDYLKF